MFEIIREGVAVSWLKQLVVSQLNANCETGQFYAFFSQPNRGQRFFLFSPFHTICKTKTDNGHCTLRLGIEKCGYSETYQLGYRNVDC